MHQHYQAFLERPSAANYRRLRSAILALPDFDAGSLELHELAALCRRRRVRQAQRKLQSMLPQWALSPRFHFLAAEVAASLGDADDAELERFAGSACLEGLLATGDGSRRFPYLVTYASDEQDLLDLQQRRSTKQALHEYRGRRYDVVECEDGSHCWFDVTDLLRSLPVLIAHETAEVSGDR